MVQLRDYQIAAKDKLLYWSKETETANTLVSVMASGKTVVTCAAIDELIKQGKRVWVIVNRVELLYQWHSELLKVSPDFDKSKLWFISSDKKPIYKRPLQFVQVQTLTSRLEKIPDEHKPDIIILDEAHETGFQRVIDKLNNRWQVKQINLTATPVRHGSSQQQYVDKYPKQHWYQAATAKEMIIKGLWKKPNWIVASEELALKTAIRFSGMKLSGGEYDDTAQSSVMIDLLPDHIAEWKANGGDKHSCVWFCVNVKHSEETYKELVKLGRKAAIVTGKSSPLERKTAIEKYKSGEITDLVNCQCLTTGFDAPIASCAVWLRRTMSVGLFCQMAGRVLRKFDGVTEGLMLDLAGNLALHPFPEDIDWFDFDPCKRLFRDPSMVVCKHCHHRHDGIPKPLHPTNKKSNFTVGTSSFDDGLEPPIKTELTCHSCKAKVFYDPNKLGLYADWLAYVASMVASGGKPKKFDGHTAGISIGRDKSLQEIPLTIESMYTLGIWKFSEGRAEKNPNKDKRSEYEELRKKLAKNLKGKSLRDLRFQLLSEKQQKYVTTFSVSEIVGISDINDKYRTAIIYAYLNDKSPVWCFKYWSGVGVPEKREVIKALASICEYSPDSYDLVKQWIETQLEEHENQKHKGVCRQFLKCLLTLKPLEALAS